MTDPRREGCTVNQLDGRRSTGMSVKREKLKSCTDGARKLLPDTTTVLCPAELKGDLLNEVISILTSCGLKISLLHHTYRSRCGR